MKAITSVRSGSLLPARLAQFRIRDAFCIAAAALVAASSASAGVFNNSFNSDPTGAIEIRDPAKWVPNGGVNNSGYISLTDAVGSQQGAIVLPDLDAGKPIGGFTATFKMRVGGGTARPADGFSFSFARSDDTIISGGVVGEEGTSTGVSINFDTWDNGGEAPAIDVKLDGAIVEGSRVWFSGVGPAGRSIIKDAQGQDASLGTGDKFADVSIELKDNLLSLTYNGISVYRNQVVGFKPIAGQFVFGARTGGAWDNHWLDDLAITTLPPSTAPVLSSFSGTPFGVSLTLTDGASQVNQASIKLTVDGAVVAPAISKSGSTTSVRFVAPALFQAGTRHTAKLEYADTSTPAVSKTVEFPFTIPNFVLVPGSLAAPAGSVDTTKAGFKARVHQIPVGRTPGDANSIANAERQLADGYIDPATSQPYANEADLSLAQNGIFTVEGVVNWNQDAPSAVGNFTENSNPPATDEPIPGIPGINGSTDNIAAEILTFLDLKAGTYRFGVNSDDGFKMTVGTNPQDVFSWVLGQFNGGRGAADTLFDVVVEKDGIYPVRVSWWEGGGGANVEFFSVDLATGQKILVNDRANPNSIKAYREGRTRAFVKTALPAPDAIDVAADTNIEFTLVDGTLQVQPTSVQLSVNGQAVQPTVTKTGSTTKVVFNPPADLPPDAKTTVKLQYSDNATPPNVTVNEYAFTTKPIINILVAIDDKQMWRYRNTGEDLGTAWREKNFNDSAWPQGPALLAAETGATAEPIRTELTRDGASGERIITDYFRTKFTFNGDPTKIRLRIRHVVDDGVAIYLNGVEVHRFFLPPTGPITAATVAVPSDHENRYEGPFEIPSTALVVGENVLAAEVHQNASGSSDIVFGLELQAVIFSAPPPPPETVLIAIDDRQQWRYNNNGQDLGIAWREKDYNDGAWPVGMALLAAETGATAEPIRTQLKRQDASGQNIITDYFRTHFTFTGDPATAKLKLRHVVDDGVAIYLNGVEVHRFFLPATGPITAATVAVPSDHENRYEGPFEISAASLVAGDNVLAAEVHQNSAGSSDVVFGLELKASVSDTPAAPKIGSITRSGSNVQIAWAGTAKLQSADAITGPWTDVANATSPFSVAVAGGARFYRLKQ